MQQYNMHEYDNAHDDYENAKIQEAQMQHDNDGHGNAINQKMNMMQEAKYDNDTHPIKATNSSNTQRQRDKRKASGAPVLGRHTLP